MARLEGSFESEILILTHLKKDAAHISKVLTEAGLQCTVCPTVAFAATKVLKAGLILITEEILEQAEAEILARAIRNQPAWSAVPLLALYGADPIQTPNRSLR